LNNGIATQPGKATGKLQGRSNQMTQPSSNRFTHLDAIKEFLLRYAASGLFPARVFNRNLPKLTDLTPAEPPIALEIVSHCWNYSHFLLYQLSSLINYPPKQLTVTFTVYYSEEDRDTVRLLDFFRAFTAKNVQWNFCPLPKSRLFRRAIGRNLAAKASKADWVWFTDCDILFHQGCLDGLARQLQGRQEILVYPQQVKQTTCLAKDDPLIDKTRTLPQVKDVDTAQFTASTVKRATGPLQIVHGDVARACGYCDDLAVYQKPQAHWAKAYEDRAFRWLLGTQGVPIEVPNVLWIRHVEKGRYQAGSRFTQVRKAVRRIKSRLTG
jgi:hypothetical protein